MTSGSSASALPPVRTVHVPLPGREYDIIIGAAASTLHEYITKTFDRLPTSAFLIYDEAVASLVPAVEAAFTQCGIPTTTEPVASGERSKSLAEFERVLNAIAETKADRRSVVVAIGGGVIGDLSGYVAASYLRGVDFIQVPTTLLAAVDSSVGGKTGINLDVGKNLVGAFHQPRLVFIAPEHFATLPTADWVAGLGEVVKYGMIADADFFTFLEDNADAILARSPEAVAHIVARSCELKAEVVLDDERETSGRRATLNYGHTFAHAYENLLGYGTLLHGEAVAIGMNDAATLAAKLGRIDPDVVMRQLALLRKLGLPVQLPESLSPLSVLAAMQSDKKTEGGQLRFILPSRLGHVELVDDVDEEVVMQTLEENAPT